MVPFTGSSEGRAGDSPTGGLPVYKRLCTNQSPRTRPPDGEPPARLREARVEGGTTAQLLADETAHCSEGFFSRSVAGASF